MRNGLAALAAALLIAGCASGGGVKVTDEQVSGFRKGETTKQEVLAALGPPTTQMRMGDGTSLLMYSHAQTKVRGATFIPIVGAFAGGADSTSTTMTLRFDTDDKLIDTSSSQSVYGTNLGGASQPSK